MIMSSKDIYSSYSNASDKASQLEMLAVLNSTSVDAIKAVVEEYQAGIESNKSVKETVIPTRKEAVKSTAGSGRRRSFDKEAILDCIKRGLDFRATCDEMGYKYDDVTFYQSYNRVRKKALEKSEEPVQSHVRQEAPSIVLEESASTEKPTSHFKNASYGQTQDTTGMWANTAARTPEPKEVANDTVTKHLDISASSRVSLSDSTTGQKAVAKVKVPIGSGVVLKPPVSPSKSVTSPANAVHKPEVKPAVKINEPAVSMSDIAKVKDTKSEISESEQAQVTNAVKEVTQSAGDDFKKEHKAEDSVEIKNDVKSEDTALSDMISLYKAKVKSVESYINVISAELKIWENTKREYEKILEVLVSRGK